MESDIIPLHSSSPPPLDDDESAGSEEDEFGDFGGFPVAVPCSSFGSSEPASNLRQPSLTIKPATHQPNCSFNHEVEQSQPTSTVNSGSGSEQAHVKGQHAVAESSLHLTNGYSERDCTSGIPKASILGTCSHTEETGFADFTVFAEQAAHPWCCGFSPVGSAEQWDGREGVTNLSNRLSEQLSNPGQEVIMDSEPKSYCAYTSKENICTKVKHCEKRTAVKSSQDCQQTQDFPSEESHLGEGELGKPGESEKEGKHSFSLQTSEAVEEGESEEDRDEKDKSASTLFQTASMYESATEDMASFSEDLSVDEPSEDFEPNVSSLASQENQTDSEEDEEEELRNYRLSKSFCKNGTYNLTSSHPEAERGFYHHDQSATQESSATSIQSKSNTEEGLPEFRCGSFEHHMHQDHVQTADAEIHSLGSLPPSDSFADFCSAPTQEDVEGAWAAFQDRTAQVEEQDEEQRSSHEDEQDWAGQYTGSKRNSCQVSLCCRVQQLLEVSFPEVVTSAEECEDEVLRLDFLLHAQQLPDQGEEEVTGLSSAAPRVPLGTWWPHQDIHSAAGLQFQWSGSHTNRTLLRCLGVDTRNIVFIGIKKQPVIVPAFASNLGMLEPTKDAVLAVCSPEHTVVTPQAPAGPQDRPNAPTDSVQGLPSSQLNWSSRGLSSSQDGCSALNLDYFGPEEESRSSSSSSRSNTPPPGVDRELYELTISKMETSASSNHLEDTLNRLMSTAEKTTTSVRKSELNEELSTEADRLISGLPNLAFMRAKVLMFPSILVPSQFTSST